MFKVLLIVFYVSACHELSNSSYGFLQGIATGMEWVAGIWFLVFLILNPINIVVAIAGLIFGAWLGKK